MRSSPWSESDFLHGEMPDFGALACRAFCAVGRNQACPHFRRPAWTAGGVSTTLRGRDAGEETGQEALDESK
jgi:hypothetical protein